MTLKQQLSELCTLATQNCDTHGEDLVKGAETACASTMQWLQYLRASQLTGTADSLLDGISSAIHEAAACAALGLVRPAINSLRLQIDLVLAWIYFKDHPVEWRRVQESGDGFKLKTELTKYMAESFPRFQARNGILRDIRTRTVEEPYRLLSAHIHGQNEAVLPRVVEPSDIVAPKKAQDELLQLQSECSEYISDILWSVFADAWASVPRPLRANVDSRFKTKAQRAEFFK